jgi:hypothetical protein
MRRCGARQGDAARPGDPDLERMSVRIRSQMARSGARRAAAGAALGAAAVGAAALRLATAQAPRPRRSRCWRWCPRANATALLANAQAALDARRAQQQAARPPAPRRRHRRRAAPAAHRRAGDAPAPAGPATLRIDFFTELPEGVLTSTPAEADPRRALPLLQAHGLFRNEPRPAASSGAAGAAGTRRCASTSRCRSGAGGDDARRAARRPAARSVLKIYFDKLGAAAATLQ